ncbi:MAG: DNA-3-methyladenine glycosylase 2 family protein [Acidobacteriota bacterium]
MPRRTLAVDDDHDVLATLRRTRFAPPDPSARLVGETYWRATRTPDGPATLAIAATPGSVEAESWGEGADWALERLPGLIGALDEPPSWESLPEPLRSLEKRVGGVRVPRTASLFEALVPTVLAQKVTGKEAKLGYLELARALAEPAPGPGPADLILPPGPERIARMGYEDFHRFGIERKRAIVLLELARRHRRVEEATEMTLDAARQRLLAFRGIGPWTVEHVAFVALGDPDAVTPGDYNLPSYVAWNMVRERTADDARMFELLEPYRGQRGRIVLWLQIGGRKPPRRGPRSPIRNFKRY